MQDFGTQMFTEESDGEWYDKNSFVIYFGKEVVLYTDVIELTQEEMSVIGVIGVSGNIKYYKGISTHYTIEEWNATHDKMPEGNTEAINVNLES